MLELFRKYQSYIYAVVTFVIVISFSFFGTYNTMPANGPHDETVFTAIDGTAISRHELEEMVHFLGTDNEDKLLFGGIWGPNFLNDGVIKKDILESGLGAILISSFSEQLQKDLQPRLEKEKHFSLYVHPQAGFISTEGAWTYFAPEMKQKFVTLKKAHNAVSKDVIDARIALFLGERKIPAPMLHELFRYQQRQNSWIAPDPNLDRTDLSLFGYHTVDDWFGPRFVRMVSEFIINASKIAEEKGYTVSKNEVLADLMRNAETSYRQNQQSPYLGVKSSNEYYNEQLRHLGIDQNKAIAIWRQVLLFRRLFDDVENAVFTDPLLQTKIYEYAKNSASGDLYQLPKEFRFNDFRSMQKFETYLEGISKKQSGSLLLPTTLFSVSEVKSKSPELVQKRYVLEISQIKKSSINSKVTLKEMWNWEADEKNWAKLTKEFPDLGLKSAKNRDDRLTALDSLDALSRNRLDNMARQAIVDQHPEWIDQALKDAKAETRIVSLRSAGGNSLVTGLTNREELMQLLDSAALKDQPNPSESSAKAANQLLQYSADKANYYRFVVIQRGTQEEIMTFAEADREGVLDHFLDKKLDAYYKRIRDAYPDKFQTEDKEWKPFEDVKNLVAERHFEKLLKEIRSDYATVNGKDNPQPATNDISASLRLFAYVREMKEMLNKTNDQSAFLRKQKNDESLSNDRLPLADQWKLEKSEYATHRGSTEDQFNHDEMLAMKEEQFSTVGTPSNGDLYFFQLKSKGNKNDYEELVAKFAATHQLLANEAEQSYMNSVVGLLKERNALSLDYLDNE